MGIGDVPRGIGRDVRVALRGAMRNSGAAVVIVLTLGLGIGSATALFTVVDAALLKALPFPDSERLVALTGGVDDPAGFRPRGSSYPEAEDWRSGNRTLEGLAAWSDGSVAVTDETGRDAELLERESVTAGYFDVLAVPLQLGRPFTVQEHQPGGPLVAILSDDLWRRRFGGDPDVFGRSIVLADRARTVVGVAPPVFRGAAFDTDVWVPLESFGNDLDRGSRYLSAVGRLRPGVPLEEAAADLRRVAARLASEYPDTHGDRTVQVTSLRNSALGETSSLLGLLLSAVALLVLIACANVTNLLLVRGADRRREILVRRALGAGRARVVGHAITESLSLSALGGGLGLLLALAGVELLRSTIPQELLPAYVEIMLDPRAFLFAAAVTVVVGALAGLAPAMGTLRSEPSQGLRDGGAATAGRSPWSLLQPGLAVGQVALALILLVGTGLMTKNLAARLRVDPGVDVERVLGFAVTLPPDQVSTEALLPTIREVRDGLAGIPGVEDVTWASDLPLRSGYSATFVYQEGRETTADRIRVYLHRAGPGAFDALGIELVAGRAIDEGDVEGNEPVGIISTAMARRFYGDRDPLGSRLRLGSDVWVRIVGVAEDVRYRNLTSDLVDGEDDPDLYLSFAQFPGRSLEFAVRTEGRAADRISEVRSSAANALPGIPLQNLAPLSDGVRAETARSRFGSTLLGVFGVLAIVLATIGVYGVLAISVRRRRREMAVRMAVGASGRRVLGMVVRQGMTLAGVGILVGLVGAYGASRALDAFLFGVAPSDPQTYLYVTLVVLAAALLAVLIPAIRATRIQPRQSLAVE